MKMSKTITTLTVVLLTMTVGFGAEGDKAATAIRKQVEQLKKENKKLDRDLQRADSLRLEEAARFTTMEKNYKQDLERRQGEIKNLKAKLSELNTKVAGEKRQQARLNNAIDEEKARNKVTMQTLIRESAGLEELIARTLPWVRERRLERARILRRDLENGSATLEEGFNRLKALYNEEIKFGDEVVTSNTSVTRNNGEVVNATVLRIGNQWLVYADEEDRQFGILMRSSSDSGVVYRWKEELTFLEREAIRNAIDIKIAKKPPALVTLPLTLSPVTGAEKKEVK